MKCLVVDSSATMRRVLANALRAAGCDEVVEATDGKQGLELCDPETCAVLTSWSLPLMSGVELTRQLRANPETAGVRVLLVTTHSLRDDVRVAIEAGVSGYLLKPFTHERLRHKLEELLHPRSADDPEPEAEAEAA